MSIQFLGPFIRGDFHYEKKKEYCLIGYKYPKYETVLVVEKLGIDPLLINILHRMTFSYDLKTPLPTRNILEFEREKSYPGPGPEPGPLAFRTYVLPTEPSRTSTSPRQN